MRHDTNPSAHHRAWARYLRSTLPNHAIDVAAYYDDDRTHRVAILTARNAGGVVAATIGLMEYDQGKAGAPIFSEVLADSRDGNEYIANVLSTVAFCVIKDGLRIYPGAVFEGAIAMYTSELNVRHAIFVPSMQWGDAMSNVSLVDRIIHPLLMIPITDAESDLVRRQGAEELELLWTRVHCDVFNWRRASAA
jgi:antitoxin YqcF